MKASHIGLAVLVALIWGFAFVAIKIGLGSFSPPQLTALRFLVACLPALFLPRPAISWVALIGIGVFLFAGQFLLLFFGFVYGMPPGLASIVMQVQAFFTIMIAMVVLHDIPTLRQAIGIVIAIFGLFMIGLTVGGDLTFLGLGLTLGGALSWAIGNVLVKRVGRNDMDMLSLMAWLSLVPPLPALAISALIDEQPSFFSALANASWLSIAAALYLGIISTAFAYAVWGHLLRQYSTALVAPFALLAPCTGVVSSMIVFGEQFDALRFVGMVLILVGLAVIIVAPEHLLLWRSAARRERNGP
jgi:O-acetylserine/cysteine efflux transporter